MRIVFPAYILILAGLLLAVETLADPSSTFSVTVVPHGGGGGGGGVGTCPASPLPQPCRNYLIGTYNQTVNWEAMLGNGTNTQGPWAGKYAGGYLYGPDFSTSYWWPTNFFPPGAPGAPGILAMSNLGCNNGFTWANAAAGNYNSNYVGWANTVVVPNSTSIFAIRVDWEWNTGGGGGCHNISCYCGPGGSYELLADAPTYIAAFRNLVTSVRSVAPWVKFEWDFPWGNGNSSHDPTVAPDYYPGDAYVDFTGYDNYCTAYGGSSGSSCYDNFVRNGGGIAVLGNYSLTDMVTFAAHSHGGSGMGYIFGEWGDTYCDGVYITMIGQWMAGNATVGQEYWDPAGGTQPFSSCPSNVTAFTSTFGNRTYSGTALPNPFNIPYP